MTDGVKPTFHVEPTLEELKKKIRPLYAELQACLAFSPKTIAIYDSEIWNQNHLIINELMKITGRDYAKFMVTVHRSNLTAIGDSINLDQYKLKLAGLLSRLHVEYFSNEPAPFTDGSPAPGMVIHNQNTQSQSQQQSQEQKVEIEQLLEIAQQRIRAEYGKEKADDAVGLIKKIMHYSDNWAIIASAISELIKIGKVAFTAALPILGKILLGTIPIQNV